MCAHAIYFSVLVSRSIRKALPGWQTGGRDRPCPGSDPSGISAVRWSVSVRVSDGIRTHDRQDHNQKNPERMTRVARKLELLHRTTAYGSDQDLVFAHPHTGKPIDRSRLLKRFKAAVRTAEVRDVRFHDLRHYVRHADGRARSANADTPGDARSSRFQDDPHLRELRAECT
jgi:integrase